MRTYFTGRDTSNRSHIGWVDLDPDAGFVVVSTSAEPVVSPGSAGLFDDSGASMGSIVVHRDDEYLFYVGWNLRQTVPWSNTIGLAIRRGDSSTFEKVGRVPIMDRAESDPFSMSYPFVLIENGIWRMWYGSNTAWGPAKDSMEHVIKYAESHDGLTWVRNAPPLMPLIDGEFAHARPVVRSGPDGYTMTFSVRSHRFPTGYQFAVAHSHDGLRWERGTTRLDGNSVANEWDSEMACYAFPFSHGGKEFLLYNGNGFGRTGFGLAEQIR